MVVQTSPVRTQSNRSSPMRPKYHNNQPNRNVSRTHSAQHTIVPQSASSNSARRVTPTRRITPNKNIDDLNNSNNNVIVSNGGSNRASPNRNIVTVNGKNNSSIIYLTAAVNSSSDSSNASTAQSVVDLSRRQRRSTSKELKTPAIIITGGPGSEKGGGYPVHSFTTSTPSKQEFIKAWFLWSKIYLIKMKINFSNFSLSVLL